MSTASVAPRPTLYSEARAMVAGGTPRRPTHLHVRALWLRLEPVLQAARRLNREATTHPAECPCPICELRVALQGAEAGR
jgi:hypothetical protein